MEESKDVDGLQFEWGKKRGKGVKKRGNGGKKIDIWLYESFTFDHEEYALYDCVYAYKEDEPEPYIGKIIKIWENADKTKRVKLLWFFRPYELSHYLKEVGGVLENELFVASGEGLGLANVNPVGVIAGKCNVVCISKDERNPQPSDKEIEKADFVFHRAFDVGQCKVLDRIDDIVAGTEVKHIFNRPGHQQSCGKQKVEAGKNEVAKDDMAEGQMVNSSGANRAKEHKNVKQDGDRQKEQSARTLGIQESGYGDKKEKESEGPKLLPRQKSSLIEVKSIKDSGESNDRPLKKQKLDGSLRVSNEKNKKSFFLPSVAEGKDKKPVNVERVATEKGLSKKPSFGEGQDRKAVSTVAHPTNKATAERGLSKKPSFDDKLTKRVDGKLATSSSKDLKNEDNKTNHKKIVEVTRRPDADRSNWFNWEERMSTAHEEGKLVLLQNLDPTYTSAEVEDIVWHGFEEGCTAKMVQHTASSIPCIGQALVRFRTREAAVRVVRKLEEGCFMLSNGRPLVGSFADACPSGKQSTFYGHLVIDKLRHQRQREMRGAVATSHCSQPNTLEYDMAMEWRWHQETFERAYEKLFKQQAEETRKVGANLKSRIP